LVRVAVKAAITSANRSTSEAGSSPLNSCTARSAHGLSRVASSQPPSSQIQRNRLPVNSSMAAPKISVMLTSPSAAGYTQRSL
jgi:hypothetical protein